MPCRQQCGIQLSGPKPSAKAFAHLPVAACTRKCLWLYVLCEAVGRFDEHPRNFPFRALNSSFFPRAYVGLWKRFAQPILIFRPFDPCFGLWLMLHKNGRSHIELQPIGEFRHMKWAISPLNTVRSPLPSHRLYKTDCAIDWLSPSTNT